MTMKNTEIKIREDKARKQLKDQGYTLEKRTNNISDIGTTANIYGHLSFENKKGTLATMSDLLSMD